MVVGVPELSTWQRKLEQFPAAGGPAANVNVPELLGGEFNGSKITGEGPLPSMLSTPSMWLGLVK
jgi:hypothetical protein